VPGLAGLRYRRMPSGPVALATVEPRPTAVIALRTTWQDYPALWPRLLDEIYGHRREDPSELETEIYWLLR
jgi:hypothetical protein